MKLQLVAKGNWIIFKNKEEEIKEETKKPSFIIPDKVKEKDSLKEVISVGESVNKIEPGDYIIVDIGYEFDDRRDKEKFNNVVKFLYDNKEYYATKLENVIGFIKNPKNLNDD